MGWIILLIIIAFIFMVILPFIFWIALPLMIITVGYSLVKEYLDNKNMGL
jgi:uncharacterized membrane protein YdbT with pleckstrin-like domain